MLKIKEFETKYTEQISRIIIRNLLEINSKDYGIKKAKEMANNFVVEKLNKMLKKREKVYIALEREEVIGTAGIDKSLYNDNEYCILTVFVKPEKQKNNVGTKLINKIEEYAKKQSIKRLIVPASITASDFYYKLGYKYKNGKKELNEENMYIMEKDLKK